MQQNIKKQIAELEAEYAELDLKQNGKKLTLNSTYGLLANKYNFMYDPQQQINVCLTGQLFLLMCGEVISKRGGVVTSYNTDGLNFYCKRDLLEHIQVGIADIESASGQIMEYVPYELTHHADVNSYLAVTPGGKVKSKGRFAMPSLATNASFAVCAKAIAANLTEGVLVEDFIRNHDNLADFMSLRKVTGGAQKDGVDVGGLARFYKSISTNTPIRYASNGDKVGGSDNCAVAMDFHDGVWDDIDYEAYIEAAKKSMFWQ